MRVEDGQHPDWKTYPADPRLTNRGFLTMALRLMVVFMTIVILWIACIIISAVTPSEQVRSLFDYTPHLGVGIFILGTAWAVSRPARCPNCKKALAVETEPGDEYFNAGTEEFSISVSAPDSQWFVCHKCRLRSEKGAVSKWRAS